MSNRRRPRPRPEGAPEPRDYQPPSPAKAEATGGDTVTVVWRDLEFTIPARPELWDAWTVHMPLAANNVLGALQGLLGMQQLAKLRVSHPTAKVEDFLDLFNEIARTTGFGSSGNS